MKNVGDRCDSHTPEAIAIVQRRVDNDIANVIEPRLSALHQDEQSIRWSMTQLNREIDDARKELSKIKKELQAERSHAPDTSKIYRRKAQEILMSRAPVSDADRELAETYLNASKEERLCIREKRQGRKDRG